MADVGLQKTGITGEGRDGRGRFRRGQSGNPDGRPVGSLNRATRAAALLLDGEAEALTRKAVEMALGGDAVALRLCLDRVLGARRGRPVELVVPAIASAGDLVAAMNAVTAAATQGAITPDEAVALSHMVDSFNRTFEADHVWRRRRWGGILWRAWQKKINRQNAHNPAATIIDVGKHA